MEQLISFDQVTCRIRNTVLFRNITWTLRRGEHWVILGPNGSGKSTLARTVAGVLPTAGGFRTVFGETHISLVSFEEQQRMLLRELEQDTSRYYAGTPDQYTTAGDLILPAQQSAPAIMPLLQEYPLLQRVWNQSLRSLSAGEMRVVFLARAFVRLPDVLILDEPFDGLDSQARYTLQHMISQSIARGSHIILATHRQEEIPSEITHAITVRDGQVMRQGSRARVLQQEHLTNLYFDAGSPVISAPPSITAPPEAVLHQTNPATETPLVQFTHTTICEGERPLITDLSWSVYPGEHWVVQGPNGSGKTTLVNLIRGEDPRGYAAQLSLFGIPRGSGESIWELRQRIGTVTPYVQLTYTSDISVLEAVVSGFYGSVGLFQKPKEAEIHAAHRVLETLGISQLAEKTVLHTSYGQRRLVMIGRALVHQPQLLLLDEPCQGLDPRNRHVVITAIDRICREEGSTVIYITHHGDEIPPSIARVLSLPGDGSWLSGWIPAATM